MTMQERQDMFAKEYLSIADFCKLYDMLPSHASKMMCDIRTKLTIGMKKELRLNMKGRLHVQDYLDWLGVTEDRYSMSRKETEITEIGA